MRDGGARLYLRVAAIGKRRESKAFLPTRWFEASQAAGSPAASIHQGLKLIGPDRPPACARRTQCGHSGSRAAGGLPAALVVSPGA